MDNISDFAKIFSDKLGSSPENIESIFNMFKHSQSVSASPDNSDDSCDTEHSKKQSESSFEMPDIETIMKIKKVMDRMKSNQNDPIINLLLSLKPFLQESKKSIIDQLIKFIELSCALSFFNEPKP